MDIGHHNHSTISTAQKTASFYVIGPFSLFPFSPHCIHFLMHNKPTLSLSLSFPPMPHFAYLTLAVKFWLLISCQIVSVQRHSYLKVIRESFSVSLSPVQSSLMNAPYYCDDAELSPETYSVPIQTDSSS